MVIPKQYAQKKISVLWFINSGILAVLFIFFTVFDRFNGKSTVAWEWYSQNIIPGLTLMTATFQANITEDQASKMIDRYYFRLGYIVSVFYFSVLYLTILLAPLAFQYGELSIIDLMERSKLYLVIFQGVVTYVLGLFFMKEK